MTFTTRLLRSLRRAIAPAAVSLGLMTGAASAAPVDFEFTTKVWSYGLSGGTGSDFPGGSIQGAGFPYGGRDIFLAGGFFTNNSLGGGSGDAVFSLTPRTYGPADLPSAFTGSALFAASFTPKFFDISGGNIGFLSSSGHYGYVVFDWSFATSTMTFV